MDVSELSLEVRAHAAAMELADRHIDLKPKVDMNVLGTPERRWYLAFTLNNGIFFSVIMFGQENGRAKEPMQKGEHSLNKEGKSLFNEYIDLVTKDPYNIQYAEPEQ